MDFIVLSSNSRKLLYEIVNDDNPSAFLSKKFDGASINEKNEMRGILRELTDNGFLQIMWADDKPYYVTLNKSARDYEEQFADYQRKEKFERAESIIIGNNNTIKNSVIAGFVNENESKQPQSFYERHPVICSILVSLFTGIVLLFPFWKKIVDVIGRLF